MKKVLFKIGLILSLTLLGGCYIIPANSTVQIAPANQG